MFVDAMKSARAFGSPDAPWDEAATVGKDGWPTGDFGAVILTLGTPDLSQQDFPPIDGTYHLTATGKANISSTGGSQVTVSNQHYDPKTNTTTADIIVGANAINIYLKFTETNDGRGGGGLKDVKLIRPGYDADTTQTFTDAFLNSLNDFQTLRYMDFSRTNDNPIVSWSARTTSSSPLQSADTGVAWEYAIELANVTGKDMWINVPSQADDNYITQLAMLLKNTLNPGINIYLEYSEEVWNGGFLQAHWNYDAAQKSVAANPSVLNYDGCNNPWYYAWRNIVVQLEHNVAIFADVFGQAAINDTIRPVLASQVGFPYVLRDQLNFLEHFYGNPSDTIYAIASAPYLGPTAASYDPSLTVNGVINALRNNLAELVQETEKYTALAAYYGLKHLAYEGGLDVQGDTAGNWLKAKLPAIYDPRMGQVVTEYLNAMYAAGIEQMLYYNQAGGHGVWGAWGLTENIYNLTGPIFKAATNFLNQPPPAVTPGTLLPLASTGGTVKIDAGSYIADQWQNTGAGGELPYAGAGSTYDYLLRSDDGVNATLTLSFANANASTLRIFLDGHELTTQSVSNTGELTIKLPIGCTGFHTLRLQVLNSGLTLRSLTFNVNEGESPPSLSIPAGLTAQSIFASQVVLTWNPFPNQTGAYIDRSTDGIKWTTIGTTLRPGDVIATGTPGGVGFARTPPVWLTPGDLLEVSVEGLGRIANRVVAEGGDHAAWPWDPPVKDKATL